MSGGARRAAATLLAAAALLPALGCASARAAGGQPRGEVWSFTAPWDPRSAASVRAHAGELDALVTGWIALDTAGGGARALYVDSLAAVARRPMALVTSWYGDRFRPETVRALAADDLALARTASDVARLAAAGRYRGLVLDFEGHEAHDLPALLRVSGAIADSARARGVSPIAMAIAATDTAAYPARPLLGVADLLIVMLYDQHWAGSGPGPTAAPDWARRWLGVRAAEVDPSRLIAGLPLYGYQWRRGEAAGRTVGWADARRLAAEAGVELTRDPASETITARAPEAWELWVTDAALVERLRADARALGVTTIAFWRLGLEDPAVWEALRRQARSR